MSTDKLVSKSDLQEFYSRILPYLGGTAEAGFTPVGTVISVMGKTAPANYLACDGSVYNIADYKELADYFLQQFESVNYFGGDGTTTFAVPDLQGEFLRGAGTNSHTNQGSGAEVGTHQDGTEHVNINSYNDSDTSKGHYITPITNNAASIISNEATKKDSNIGSAVATVNTATSAKGTAFGYARYTSRPTNTSVLFCIATKNIYLNPSLDFSTSEKVVGTWLGKPLYQKTFFYDGTLTVTESFTSTELYDLTDLNIDKITHLEGFTDDYGNSHGWYYFPSCAISSPTVNGFLDVFYDKSTKKALFRAYRSSGTLSITGVYFTVQYTKTTD